MLVAVLSDIHANAAALKAVLADAGEADAVWFCGDLLGYGTEAAEAVALLRAADPVCVMGNHDTMPAPELTQDARDWLAVQPLVRTWVTGSWAVMMAHGTPSRPLEGRYYPDDTANYPWLPGPGEILILGQTHYPLLRGAAGEGMLLNPGSVGQPRDGNPDPSWALLDTGAGTAELRRTGGRP